MGKGGGNFQRQEQTGILKLRLSDMAATKVPSDFKQQDLQVELHNQV